MNRTQTLLAFAIGLSVAIGGPGCGGSDSTPDRAGRIAAQITGLQNTGDVTCARSNGDSFSCRGDMPRSHGRFTAISNSQGLYVNLSPGVDPTINGHSVRGRMLKFSAELPSGWSEQPERVSVYPGLLGIQLPVRFASFHLPQPGPIWPVRGVPRAGVVVALFPEERVSQAAVQRAGRPTIKRPDQPGSRSTNGYWAGWRFRVWAEFGRSDPRPHLVRQVNQVIRSFVVVGHLCPCRGRT
jgi:hypothetical protein